SYDNGRRLMMDMKMIDDTASNINSHNNRLNCINEVDMTGCHHQLCIQLEKSYTITITITITGMPKLTNVYGATGEYGETWNLAKGRIKTGCMDISQPQ
ncbi:unnamed protein product, partial [Ceratitis capitata]